jgi:hypothetical protein
MKGMVVLGAAFAATMSLGAGVAQANVAPSISAPASISVNEDTAFALTSLSFTDSDSGGAPETVTLSVDSGRLTSTYGGPVTTTGSGTATLRLRGVISDINAAFSNGYVRYQDAADANGSHTLHVEIDDEGNAGGGSLTDAVDIPVTVAAVNDAPVITYPTTRSLDQDGTLVLSTANNDKFSIADVDAGSAAVQVTLAATHGTLTLAGTTGLTFTTGTGTADATMTFEGALSDVDTALDGLTYRPAAGYSGAAALQVDVDDQGNTGSGGSRTAERVVAVNVISPTPQITDIRTGSSLDDNTTWHLGNPDLLLAVTFNRPVTVAASALGFPTLRLGTTPFTEQANYLSGSGSNRLLFAYRVMPGDHATALDAVALQLNGATIKAVGSGIDTLLSTPTGADTGSLASHHIAVDAPAAVVTGVDLPADGVYGIGSTLDFKVHYDQPVTVTGTPSLGILGGLQTYAPLVAGSGTDTLTFRYTVTISATTTGGITVGQWLRTGGATIKDGSANAASLRILENDTRFPNVDIDGVAPYATSFGHDGDLTWTLKFGEPVSGVDASDFDVVTTGTAAARSVTVEAVDATTYRITLHDAAGAGTVAPHLKESGTGIVDRAGNALRVGDSFLGGEGNQIGEAYTLPVVDPPVVTPPDVVRTPAVTTPTPTRPQPPVVVTTKPSLRTATIASSCTKAKTLALKLAGTGVAKVEIKVAALKTSARQRGCSGLNALKVGKAVGKAKALTLKAGTNKIAYRHGLKPGAYVVTFTPIAADGTRGAAVTRRIRILK